jgi:hypothetical protein
MIRCISGETTGSSRCELITPSASAFIILFLDPSQISRIGAISRNYAACGERGDTL